jgi:hypothetical protein
MLAQGPIVNAAEKLLSVLRSSFTLRARRSFHDDHSMAIDPLIATSSRHIVVVAAAEGRTFKVPNRKFCGSDQESSPEAASERRINVALMRRYH